MKICVTLFILVLTMSSSYCHLLSKRQSNAECVVAQTTAICSNGYQEDYAYVSEECYSITLARSIRNSCRVNGQGVVCGSLDTYEDQQMFDTVCGGSTTTCSPECRDFITNTRDRYGCCTNIFNSTSLSRDGEPFSYSVWSLCGVDTIEEECAPSSFRVPARGDPTCTSRSTLTERLYKRVLCRREFLDSLRNVSLSTGSNCDYDDGSAICAVSDLTDQYCQLGPNIYDNGSETTAELCQDTSTCDPVCTESIRSLVAGFGCCVISQLNDSSSTQDRGWLSQEFWQRCGLTSPGFCQLRFDDSPYRISADVPTTTTATTAATVRTTPPDSTTATAATTTGASTSVGPISTAPEITSRVETSDTSSSVSPTFRPIDSFTFTSTAGATGGVKPTLLSASTVTTLIALILYVGAFIIL